MCCVYILYSKSINFYYVGCTKNLAARLTYHHQKEFIGSFTKRASDWILFYVIEVDSITTARKIEQHIKKMKSKKYIENLSKHPEIGQRLVVIYS